MKNKFITSVFAVSLIGSAVNECAKGDITINNNSGQIIDAYAYVTYGNNDGHCRSETLMRQARITETQGSLRTGDLPANMGTGDCRLTPISTHFGIAEAPNCNISTDTDVENFLSNGEVEVWKHSGSGNIICKRIK